ncbi:tRNA pseudouridine(13) synthase TruD [Vibrio sp. S4M6]|uniref:tRNA pseudouridine(13) synthase TruD n=1 Tax=Vibrio sinus TaxID=2946865 RepID=UPI00202A7121|nr:tRNA pseudouridine(13) synthase TruD [Vibrio sinus]MCL9780980.1 tRNA pseudouridine(13) synthase TruD [Vibrio sinus]
MSDMLSSLSYLYGKPTATAKLKAKPEHFQVNECLGFDFAGHGEHFMVRIRKTGENTTFVANELAKACGVASKDVSWAGLKDRHAVTEQWLSVRLPKNEQPDLSGFLSKHPTIEVLQTSWHSKKLRPGDLVGNDFVVALTEVSDVEDVEKRLQKISESGVPNYFGNQRFGRDGNNLKEARRWGKENVRTRNANKRSMYLSAARSWIFNTILSERIEKSYFNQLIIGDIAQKDSTLFNVTEDNIAQYNQQLFNADVAITAALPGDNALPTQSQALELEQKHLDSEPDLMALIRGNRMRHDRRPIMLRPNQLTWQIDKDTITLSFSLEAGCFATAIVRELINEIEVERSY